MAKKRLSDLLREEGKKSETDAEQESAKGQAKKQPEPDTPEPDAIDASKPIDVTAEVVTSQAELVEGFVAELKAAEPTDDSSTDDSLDEASDKPPQLPDELKAELEATVLRLKQDIEAARQIAQETETVFNQQIADLQGKLAERDKTIQLLQVEIQQVAQQAEQQVKQNSQNQLDRLKAELEEARQTILQLSQANAPKPQSAAPARSSLYPPAPPPRPGSLSRSSVPPVLSSPTILPSTRAAEPELEPSKSQLVMPLRSPARPPAGRPTLHELELHKVLDHPTQPGSLPPMSSEPKPAEKEEIKLSDTDVGWMD
jgi:DNA polymerase III alpha subunit (gram-positive type)